MQERYLGDSHDFIKYAVLKALHGALGGPVGLNWYLTQPENVDGPENADGEQRHHLTQPVWQACDPVLVEAMADFSDPTTRTLTRFESSGVLARHHAVFPEDNPLPLLRGRSSPNIFLQLAAPPSRQAPVLDALDKLVGRLPEKLEWITT